MHGVTMRNTCSSIIVIHLYICTAMYSIAVCKLGFPFCILSSEQLGALGKQHTFTCDTSDRASAFIQWWRDDTLLSTDSDKYGTTTNTLTVYDIVDSDEGNYSCKYMNMEDVTVERDADCLLVYGKKIYMCIYNVQLCFCQQLNVLKGLYYA